MSEHEHEDHPQDQPQDGVALSPYDADLRPADGEPVTGELELAVPEGYEEPAEGPEPAAEAAGAAEGEPELPADDATDAAEEPETQALATEEPATQTVEAAPAEPVQEEMAAPAALAAVAATRAASEPDPLSDTAVRRTSLLRPTSEELPSNEPTALREATEADPRVEKYGNDLDDADLFEGAIHDKVPSRVPAHILSVVSFLLLIPIAWYLLSDAGARMTLPENAQWSTGTMNIAPFGEMIGGLLVLFAAFWAARTSSVGPWVMGVLLSLFGGMFVVTPGFAKDLVDGWREPLQNFHEGLGGNIHHHLASDGSTGRLLVLGVLLILTGVVAHSARRRGVEEQRIRAAVERRKAREAA